MTVQPPVRPRRLFLVALVAVTGLGPLAMQIFVPALPLIQVDYRVSTGTAQLGLSLAMLAIAVSTLVYGPLSDRLGRRPVVLAGLWIYLVGSLACVLAPSIEVLILGRVVQATGATAGMVLSRAMVRDIYPQEKVAGALAAIAIAMSAAPMIGPAIGGELTDRLGWRAIFGFGAAVGFGVLLLAQWRLRETRPARRDPPGLGAMLADMRLLFGSARFNGYAWGGAFGHSVFFSFFAAAPYLMVNSLGRPAREYGYYFVGILIAFMAGSGVAVRWSERLGGDRMVMVGSAIAVSGAGLALALALAGVLSPASLFLPTALTLFGMGPVMANLQAGALGVHPHAAGSASGLIVFLQMGLGAVFAQLVGLLQDGTPLPMTGFMAAAVLMTFATFLIAWRANRRAA